MWMISLAQGGTTATQSTTTATPTTRPTPAARASRRAASPRSPLAVRMRPRTLDDVVGQQHLLGQGSPLRQLAAGTDATGPAGPSSLILWGPPGTGKTTLAHVIAKGPGRKFVELSAITAGVKDVRRVMDEALTARDLFKTTTVLFLDEIHRFNKAQQDALLPGVENRWVVLVAATTENPSFSVVSPLLSRSLLLTLKPLTDADVEGLLPAGRRRMPAGSTARWNSATRPWRTLSGSPAGTPAGR